MLRPRHGRVVHQELQFVYRHFFIHWLPIGELCSATRSSRAYWWGWKNPLKSIVIRWTVSGGCPSFRRATQIRCVCHSAMGPVFSAIVTRLNVFLGQLGEDHITAGMRMFDAKKTIYRPRVVGASAPFESYPLMYRNRLPANGLHPNLQFVPKPFSATTDRLIRPVVRNQD